jgi:predicted dehydrogenase
VPANSQTGPGDPAGAPGPVRAAVAGPGNIARVHANALRSLAGQAESVAVTDVDDSR